jgi:hypothetical protein
LTRRSCRTSIPIPSAAILTWSCGRVSIAIPSTAPIIPRRARRSAVAIPCPTIPSGAISSETIPSGTFPSRAISSPATVPRRRRRAAEIAPLAWGPIRLGDVLAHRIAVRPRCGATQIAAFRCRTIRLGHVLADRIAVRRREFAFVAHQRILRWT